jgi:hypothetical protein
VATVGFLGVHPCGNSTITGDVGAFATGGALTVLGCFGSGGAAGWQPQNPSESTVAVRNLFVDCTGI